MKTKENTVKKFWYFLLCYIKSKSFRRIGRVLAIIFINLLVLELLSLLVVTILFKQGYKSIVESKDQYIVVLASQGSTPELTRQTEGNNFWGRRQLHPYFGYTFLPGWRNMNNFGFATRFNYPYAAQKDEFVVGFFGGSVAAQIYSWENKHKLIAQTLLLQLEKKGYNRITVLNFTNGGYRQPMDLFVFLYFLHTIDMAIFIEGFNDIIIYPNQNNYPLDFPPKSVWNVLASKKFSQIMLEAVGRLQYNISRQRAWTGIFRKPVLRYSMFCHILWKLIISGYAREEQAIQKEIAKEVEEGSGFTNVHPLGYGVDQIVDLYFQRYEYHLKTAALVGRDANIPCLFVLQPNQYLKGSKLYSQEERSNYMNNKRIQDRVNRYYPRLRNMYARLAYQGIFTFDAAMIFKNIAQTVYKDDCCHFNNAGLEIICRAIMADLLKKKEVFTIIPEAHQRQCRLLTLTEHSRKSDQ